METKTIIILIPSLIGLFGLFYLFYQVTIVSTIKFYNDCDKLEADIKAEDNCDEQFSRLVELNKFSWHRTTNQRISELGKMLEVKYGVKVFK